MSPRILVTGAGGFSGRHLCLALAEAGCREVIACDRLAPADDGPVAAWHCIDLGERESVVQLLHEVRPEWLMHLAGTRSDDATTTIVGNMIPTLNLLCAAATLPVPPRTLLVGSAAEYGDRCGDRALNETAPCAPVTAYGFCKLALTEMGLRLARAGKLPVIVARPFNLLGPGQPEGQVVGAIAARILGAKRRGEATIDVGARKRIRDFYDVRDAAAAYMALMVDGQAGEVYNVCSGRGRSVGTLVDKLLEYAGGGLEVRSRPSMKRAGDVARCVGDPQKLLNATRLRARYSFEESLRDAFEEARQRLP